MSNFAAIKNLAKQRYGTSDVRPQDLDRELLVRARFNNNGRQVPVPEGYKVNLLGTAKSFQLKKCEIPRISLDHPVTWVSHPSQDLSNWNIKHRVIAVDLEFHNDDTFEGKISNINYKVSNHYFNQ